MDPAIKQLVQTIHDSPNQTVLVTAGAGTQALSWLLGVAGASRTLIEGLVPYGRRAFQDFLDQKPAKHVNQQASRLMAGRAMTRGRFLREQESAPIIGLACTATIITDRPKRGEHRAHITTWQAERVVSYSLYLEKGSRDRVGEENLVSMIMLNALAAAYGIEKRLELNLRPSENIEILRYDIADAARRLYQGKIPFFGIGKTGRLRFRGAPPKLVLPGSFNPVHDGHLDLARFVERYTGLSAVFELSAYNVEKPPLEPSVILDRVAQFGGRWPIYVTSASTFIKKARLFPGATFVVGYDTATRIFQPRFYDDSVEQMEHALQEFQDLGCRFLVVGRIDANGEFNDPTQLDIPAHLRPTFELIPASQFRHDISSSQLRAAGLRGSR